MVAVHTHHPNHAHRLTCPGEGHGYCPWSESRTRVGDSDPREAGPLAGAGERQQEGTGSGRLPRATSVAATSEVTRRLPQPARRCGTILRGVVEPGRLELPDRFNCLCERCDANQNAVSSAGREWRIPTPTLEPLESRTDSCQGRTEVASPSRQASRATTLCKASSVRLEGLEPPTTGSEDRCSIQLSYRRIFVEGGRSDGARTRNPWDHNPVR